VEPISISRVEGEMIYSTAGRTWRKVKRPNASNLVDGQIGLLSQGHG
jgi:hypothetical protein